MTDLLTCAWRELARRKGRTAVTVGGYLVAVASVVVLVTALGGARHAADQVLTRTGTHFMAFAPASLRACPACTIRQPGDLAEGFEANNIATGLVPFSLVERVRQLPTVRDASPYLRFRFKDPRTNEVFAVGGFDPANQGAVGTTCCAATDVLDGRFLAPEDKGRCMLEEGYAKLKGLKVGDPVTVAGETFEVVGIVNPGIRPAKADVYMHFDDAQRAVNRRLAPVQINREANAILVEVRSSTLQEAAMASVKSLMPGLLVSSYACYRPAAQVMGINEKAIEVLAVLIAACALIVAMKTQLASIIERRRDIAILKAIGWTDRSVVLQVVAESVLVAIVGGALGCAAAAGILAFAPIAAWSDVPAGIGIPISRQVLGAAFGLALVGGVVAAIIPALAAARQRPAEALRRV